MKVLPPISDEERQAVQLLLSGDEEAKEHPAYKEILSRRNVKKWISHLRNATPEELIEQMYTQTIAFGKTGEQMKAAEKYLESKFAGKDIADIFIDRLCSIGAEIQVACEGRLEKVKIAAGAQP